ncbi:uncharacterized protein LOC128326215 [Hemicordylus capensis]|uniref:uncharacterized protein LOC128326215 n=1 Tax=Hemicordylus capensis TaxID=884348 RepID=UPI0023044FCA|nr:uncharacterized protein LOC128326215 [Hemicordylus capensis]
MTNTTPAWPDGLLQANCMLHLFENEEAAAMVPVFFPTEQGQSQKAVTRASADPSLIVLMGTETQPSQRNSIPCADSIGVGHNRCFAQRLGQALHCQSDPKSLDPHPMSISYKLPGTVGGFPSHESLPSSAEGEGSTTAVGQHYCNHLPQQTGQNSLQVSLCTENSDLALVHQEQHHPCGPSLQRHGECSSRWPKSLILDRNPLRVGVEQHLPVGGLRPMGIPRDRLVCYSTECKMQAVLLDSQPRPAIFGGCFLDGLVTTLDLHVCPAASSEQSSVTNPNIPREMHPYHTMVALSSVVSTSIQTLISHVRETSKLSRPSDSEKLSDPASRKSHPTTNGMEDQLLNKILLTQREPSIRKKLY